MKNQKKQEKLLKDFLSSFDLDMTAANLKDTPERVARMFSEELFSSLSEKPPHITVFSNEKNYDEIIMLDNIPFTSICSHHLVFFSGKSWLLYQPDKLLVGASKVARLIDYHCKKPQLQENLSEEIMEDFMDAVQPKGAMLVMRGVHSCMSYRGVKTGACAGMMTSVIRGGFSNPSLKAEALELIRISIMDRGGV